MPLKNKLKYILFSLLIAILFTHCRDGNIKDIDIKLSRLFNTFNNPESPNCDSIAQCFKAEFIKQLSNPITFSGKFDSLSTYVNAVSSNDHVLKFYSWDQSYEGTWHEVQSLVQFKTADGKIKVQQLNSADGMDYTDSGIYRVYTLLNNDGTSQYLTLAGGTHGEGMQHQLVRIYSLTGDSLINCKSCFEEENGLLIEYPRAREINLDYDPETKKLCYNSGLGVNCWADTSKTIELRICLILEDGVFRTQK